MNYNELFSITLPELQLPSPVSPKFSSGLNDLLNKQQQKYLDLQHKLDEPLPEVLIEHECEPPTQTRFSSLELGKEYLKTYMRQAQIGLVICDSRLGSYTLYRCDRGGSYRDRRNIDQLDRIRKLHTRKCNCPFKLRIKFNKLDHHWYLIINNPKHNHHLSNLENLPVLRRRDDTIKRDIKELLDKGIKNPTQIRSLLIAKHEDIVITKRDIYNEIGQYTRKHRAGEISS